MPQGRTLGQSSSQKGWSPETPHPNRKTRPQRTCAASGLPVPSPSSLETRGKQGAQGHPEAMTDAASCGCPVGSRGDREVRAP